MLELEPITTTSKDYAKQHKFDIANITNEVKVKIIEDFTYNLLTHKELSKKYKTPQPTIERLISDHRDAINNKAEMEQLIETGDLSKDTYKVKVGKKVVVNPEVLNSSFLKLLSEDTDTVLTTAESIYAWTYAHLGDNAKAIAEAGLDVALPLNMKGKSKIHGNAVKVRGYYLRRKPNVLKFIKEIQLNHLQDLSIDKSYVQSEIIQQIEMLKECGDPKKSLTILKAIDMLGKTVGAFTEVIKIEEASAGDALDHLIEMAKEATVIPKEITQDEI